MTTYQRDKPCPKCGHHEYYRSVNRCVICTRANSKKSANNNPEVKRNWQIANRDYLKNYNQAYYQRKKERDLMKFGGIV